MHTSSRFAVALHTLVFLVARSDKNNSVTSALIAESVNTHPVVIRRILGTLRESKIVSSQSGASGGWCLKRKPEEISLRDVYRALESDPLFALPRNPANSQCEIGRHMQKILDGYFHHAERAAEERLGQITLAHITRAVTARTGDRSK